MPYLPTSRAPEHTIISTYLQKVLRNVPGHENINLIEMPPSPSWPSDGVRHRMACKICKIYVERVSVDWSVEFGLDNMVQALVDFTKDHAHTVEQPERVFQLE